MTSEIIECGINYLSYERALTLVPHEFKHAYEWFLSKENQIIPRLPRGKDDPHLQGNIKISSQRGMHSPNYNELESKGGGKKKYILSAYSVCDKKQAQSGESVKYADKSVVEHNDGTWTVEYACQEAMEGKRATERSNDYMMNNLKDGVPVALMIGTENGYRVQGLAYVEAYNPITNMFTLHGPVSAEKHGAHFFSELAYDSLSPEEKEILRRADDSDAEAFASVQIMKRRHQDQFRKAILRAYENHCAVTEVSTPSVLQAAHIDPFAKSRSHSISNGILLRADIHLLYDAHLMTILPLTREVVMSESVIEPAYLSLSGKRIHIPDNPEYKPNDDLLAIHLSCFNNRQRKMGLRCI